MSRSLRFRAWNRKLKDFAYVELDNELLAHFVPDYDLEPWQQYTGLKDKNGDEIFEGDILLIGGRPRIVQWDKYQTGYTPFCQQIPSAADAYSEWTFEDNGEIIGNLNETPELLEAKS